MRVTDNKTGQAHDLLEIRRALTVLYQPGDVVELRVLDVGGKTIAGYFDDHAKLAEAAAKLSGSAAGVYVVLNKLTPALLARSANRLTTNPRNLTQDNDIVRRRYLPIDVDAKRPSGISSTDTEHNAAIKVAKKIKEYLIGLGFPTNSIIVGDSGNGAHLLVRVDLPNDEDSTNLIKTCLGALAMRFDDDAVSIDPGVFNAARIWKLPGTLARKGDSTPDRPHRLARLLDVPDTLAIAPIEALRALAATLPAEPKETPRPYRRGAQPFDLVAWMSAHDIEVKSSGPYRGGIRYILKQCVFNEDHAGTSVAIFQGADGKIGYKCQHAECVGKTWADVRELKESGYKERAHKALNLTGLPVIVVNNRQLRDITTDVLAALYESNKVEPKLFQRSGNLVRVSIDEKQNPYIDPLTESALRGLLTRAADFIKVSTNAKGKVVEIKVSPPLNVVRDILSLRGWQFPPLLSLIEVPVICSDGTIIDRIGYDAKTCLYYHPSPELRVPPVPDTPTESDVRAAKALLLEVICNFPFDSEASGANAVAAMLTPVVRPVIDGLVPLAVFDKPQPGTGAGLLADVIAFIPSGQTAGMLGGQRKEEEWRKAITTILLYGRSVICIDNIDGDLNSTSLSTVLTARVWRDRILGRNEEALLPNMSTWIANGNNIRLVGGLSRRAYRSRLDAQLAQPWLRKPSEFEHPDLIKWVRERRGDIVAAMLTIARAWVVAGKPKPEDLIVIGSYESFCEVLGGILDYIKVKGFLGNLQQMYAEMDVETPQWANFLEVWQEAFGNSEVTVAEVMKELNKNEVFVATLPDSIADREVKGYSQKLGGALARRKDVRFPNELMIQAGKIKHHATAWRVVKAVTASPLFSFKGEAGESSTTPRVNENEEDDSNKELYEERVEPNSPASPLASKRGELAPGGVLIPDGRVLDWNWCLDTWAKLGKTCMNEIKEYDISRYSYPEKLSPQKLANIVSWLESHSGEKMSLVAVPGELPDL